MDEASHVKAKHMDRENQHVGYNTRKHRHIKMHLKWNEYMLKQELITQIATTFLMNN